MGEVINLRRAKKAAMLAEKEKTADANRISHGMPKHMRKAAKAEKERTESQIESRKLDPDDER